MINNINLKQLLLFYVMLNTISCKDTVSEKKAEQVINKIEKVETLEIQLVPDKVIKESNEWLDDNLKAFTDEDVKKSVQLLKENEVEVEP